MFEGIRSASLPVTDLPLAQAWYAQVLDCPALPAPSGEGVSFYLNGYLLTLVPGQPGGGATVFWSVDNLDQELARLLVMGARLAEAVTVIDPHTRQATVLDPCGNPLGLIERSDPAELRARSQRAAERIALRNVRGTLDSLQASEPDARRVRRLVAAIVVAALVIGAAFLYLVLPAPAAKGDQLVPVAPASQSGR